MSTRYTFFIQQCPTHLSIQVMEGYVWHAALECMWTENQELEGAEFVLPAASENGEERRIPAVRFTKNGGLVQSEHMQQAMGIFNSVIRSYHHQLNSVLKMQGTIEIPCTDDVAKAFIRLAQPPKPYIVLLSQETPPQFLTPEADGPTLRL